MMKVGLIVGAGLVLVGCAGEGKRVAAERATERPSIERAAVVSRPCSGPASRPWYAGIQRRSVPMPAGVRPEEAVFIDPMNSFLDNSNRNPQLNREAAFEALLTTNTFAARSVAAGAITSGQAWAFATILGLPDAREAFADLLTRGQPAGQLYALCGLFILDLAAYEPAVERYRDSTQEVLTFFGCLCGPRRVGELVARREVRGSSLEAVAWSLKRLAEDEAKTRPAAWYSTLQRRTDPIEDDPIVKDDPFYDPMDWFAASSYSNPHFDRKLAYEALLTTTTFCNTAVGGGGITPGQAWAFVTILRQPDAREAFEDLLKRGRLAGQLYGLCGLYLLDRAAYERCAAPYRRGGLRVNTLIGCIGKDHPVAYLLAGDDGRAAFLENNARSHQRLAEEMGKR